MGNELLTSMELAELLKVQPSTIRRWASNGTITAVRIGGICRYRLEDVLAAEKKSDEERSQKKLKVNRPKTPKDESQ